MTLTPPALRAQKLGPQVAAALKKRHFDAYFCPTAAEALRQALELIPAQDTVSWGGSASIQEIGLLQALKERNQPVLDRDSAQTPDERRQLMRRALTCDTFLMSTNALSQDGQLVNVDGNGNRVAALMYGPKQVIVIAGTNKIVKDSDAALVRARTVAAPINAQRFAQNKTPCLVTGECANCTSTDCICAQVAVTRLCRPAGRIKVIIVGEDLGY